jgi:hypothetical protein
MQKLHTHRKRSAYANMQTVHNIEGNRKKRRRGGGEEGGGERGRIAYYRRPPFVKLNFWDIWKLKTGTE